MARTRKVPVPKNLDFSYAWMGNKPKVTAYVYTRYGVQLRKHVIIKSGKNTGVLRDGRTVYKYRGKWYLMH
ncbi:MAG: hypothetical protein DRJ64_09270 [Thermoprotei archaeon]|nr:MAG: hypothetical protein DRJ64_09270 [Thermoprotei archaeon]